MNRFGAARIIAAGMVAFVAAYALFLRIDVEPRYAAIILPTILLVGVGFALAFPALNIQATAGVRDEEQGLASGLLQTSFQIGGAVVLAAVSAVIAAGHAEGTGLPRAVLSGYVSALGLVTGVSALGLVAALAGVVPRRRPAVLAARIAETGTVGVAAPALRGKAPG